MPASKGAKVYFMQDYGAAGQPLDKVHTTWKLGLKTITISRYLQSEIERVAGVKAALAPCGVDTSFFLDQERKARAGAPTVGFVYSNNAMKGSPVCIEAIRLARQSIPDLRAVAFGPKRPDDPLLMPPFIAFKANVSEAEARALYAS
jgi:glycosyltransferase involved in cell wall biosynthesis